MTIREFTPGKNIFVMGTYRRIVKLAGDASGIIAARVWAEGELAIENNLGCEIVAPSETAIRFPRDRYLATRNIDITLKVRDCK